MFFRYFVCFKNNKTNYEKANIYFPIIYLTIFILNQL